jgi:hypothetical protein
MVCIQFTLQSSLFVVKFKVCKSVHHHTIQINQPARCNHFSSLLLHVYVELNVFRAFSRHHQELNNCSSSLWFYRWNVVGPEHCYHHAPTVKPEAATAVIELLMMGVRTPETCWALHKRQVINLRNCCT